MIVERFTPTQITDAKDMAKAIAGVPEGTRPVFDLMVEAMLVGVMSTKVEISSGTEDHCPPIGASK